MKYDKKRERLRNQSGYTTLSYDLNYFFIGAPKEAAFCVIFRGIYLSLWHILYQNADASTDILSIIEIKENRVFTQLAHLRGLCYGGDDGN